MQTDAKARKKLFEYLPAIYQDDDSPEKSSPLREFLGAFEKVLLGYEDEPTSKTSKHGHSRYVEGLGKKIERMHELFDPEKTDSRFLPWLAGWAALSLRVDMPEPRQRALIARIVPLYSVRGTKRYLEELLQLCVDVPAAVSEVEIPPLRLGMRSTIGEDTYIGGGPPHYFRVDLLTEDQNANTIERQRQIAYEVIEMAKPAHTTYELSVQSPRFQVGIHSTIGLDTVLSPTAA